MSELDAIIRFVFGIIQNDRLGPFKCERFFLSDSELNNEVTAKTKEARALKREKDALETQLGRLKEDFDTSMTNAREQRQRAEALQATLQRTIREFEVWDPSH